MRELSRRIVLPTVTVVSLLATGCSAVAPSSGDADSSAGPAATATSSAEPDELGVAAAPAGKAVSSAVARPAEGTGRAEKSPVTVASYDPSSGRAVISGPSRAPEESADDTDSGDEGTDDSDFAGDGRTAVGDVIASAPAPGAPDGLLAKVTEVVKETEEGTEVETEPATLSALLGDSQAEGTVPVDPSAVEVEPLVEGVKVSWAKTDDVTFGPEGAKLPLGSLRIDVGASIDTPKDAPASASASVDGFVQLAPEVEFSYDGSGGSRSGADGSPGAAFLGLSGDWASQWKLKGRAAGATEDGKPLRIPFAELRTDPVIQVGPVPIVVNLGLVCYFQVDGDGRISVEVEQDLKGDFRVGGSFSWARGWTPVSRSEMTGEPLRTSVAAAGKVKAALGAEASVGLYGAVGVSADFAPYLRGEAEGSGTGSADGTGSGVGSWKLFGGLDLSGSLNLQLSIFGTPVFQTRIPLGTLNREWKLAEGEGPPKSA